MQVNSRVSKLISDWMSNDENKVNNLIRVMKEIVSPSKKTCFVLLGDGNNGKSTFLRLISMLVTTKRVASADHFKYLSNEVIIVEEDTDNFYDCFMNIDNKVCLYVCNCFPEQLKNSANVEIIKFDSKFNSLSISFNEEDATELRKIIQSHDK